MIYDLDSFLSDLIQSETSNRSLKEAFTEGQEKLRKYFAIQPNLDDLAVQANIIASILDPRFKLRGLRHWLELKLILATNRIRLVYNDYERLCRRLNPAKSPDSEDESQNTRLTETQERIYSLEEDETHELTRYLAEPRAKLNSDPLDWRKNSNYTALKLMAKDYLGILASSAALEGEFARISDTANPRKRNRLTKRRINELSCIKSWQGIKDLPLPPEEDQSDDSDFPPSIQEEALSDQSEDESDLGVSD
jgi:hypothetical protein